MTRRFGIVPLMIAGLLALGASSAMAATEDRAQGHFTTKQGAAVDFLANADLTGTLSYVGALSITCDGYATYVSGQTNKGQPKVTVTSTTCVDTDGAAYTLSAWFVDRGQGQGARPDKAMLQFTDSGGQVVVFTQGNVRGTIQIK